MATITDGGPSSVARPTPSWPSVAVLAFAVSVGTSQLTVLVPLLPGLQAALGMSLETATWTVTATLLAGAVSMPVLTGLGDIYGRRRLILIGLLLLFGGSLVAIAATEPVLLLIGRVLQGSAAAMLPLAIGLVREVLPPSRMATGIGVLSATIGVGSGGGMIVAGVTGDHRTVFALLGALCAVAFALIALVVREPSRTNARIAAAGRTQLDLPGVALLAAMLLCLLLALSQGNAWGWRSPAVVGLLLASALATIAWLLWTRRAPAPLIDVSVLVDARTISATIASLLFGYALFGFITPLSAMLQFELGGSVLDVGLCLLPTVILMLVVSIVSGPLMRRFSSAVLVAIGAIFIAAASVCALFIGDEIAVVLVATTLLGVGVGLGYAAVGTMAVAHVEPAKTAAASGLNALVRLVGSSLAGATTAAVLGTRVDGAFDIVFTLTGAAAVVAALMAFLHIALVDRRDP